MFILSEMSKLYRHSITFPELSLEQVPTVDRPANCKSVNLQHQLPQALKSQSGPELQEKGPKARTVVDTGSRGATAGALGAS